MLYSKRLQLERIDNELLQKDIAKILNIDNTRYSHYENENEIMPIKYLITLSYYFKVSLDYLFEFSDERRYSKTNKDFDLNLFAARLKEFRKSKNLTQKDIANTINTNRSVIANYERGRNIIPTAFLYGICKKYGVSADWLLGITNEPKNFN